MFDINIFHVFVKLYGEKIQLSDKCVTLNASNLQCLSLYWPNLYVFTVVISTKKLIQSMCTILTLIFQSLCQMAVFFSHCTQ